MRHAAPPSTPACIVLLALPVLLAGCTTTSQGTSDDDPSVISQREIQEIEHIGDAYTLVEHYEPQWLETRGQGSLNRPNEVVVYLDNSYQGGPSSLRQISVTDVQRIEYLEPAEANMQFGTGHANGAIMVHLKEGNTADSP